MSNIKENEDGTLSVIDTSITTYVTVPIDNLIFMDDPPCGYPNAERGVDGSIYTMDLRWPCYEHLEPYLNPVDAVKCEICGRRAVS